MRITLPDPRAKCRVPGFAAGSQPSDPLRFVEATARMSEAGAEAGVPATLRHVASEPGPDPQAQSVMSALPR